MKTIASIILLAGSAIFLIVSIAQDKMGTSGIAKIKLDLPQLLPRKAFKIPKVNPLPYITQLGDITQLPDIPSPSDLTDLPHVTNIPELPTDAKSIISHIATRVSEGISQATSAVSALGNVPESITLGTYQICYIAKNDNISCQNIPSDISSLFPGPLNALLDLDSIDPLISVGLKVNVRSCLIATLVGVLFLAALIIALRTIDITTFGIFSRIPLLKAIIEISVTVLVFIPLILAASITFSTPSLLRKVEYLQVENGDLVWCIGLVLGFIIAGVGVRHCPSS
ncbi:hypothetical protein F4814DRAFT_280834 [Daldinia grandis]|nr:hypothetical protein F4814DRAFT_280834 [Daldinia grandis]